MDWSPRVLRWEMVLSQAPRQRVGGECRRRLMSMLSCAKRFSTIIKTPKFNCFVDYVVV